METKEISIKEVRQAVYVLPNRQPFMLAADLAAIYRTKRDQVTQAVRRNPKRFPPHFAFRLEPAEVELLRAQARRCHFQNERDINIPAASQPLVFTRLGANMLSAVLKSDVAAERSVMIMEAFSAIEEAACRGKDSFSAGFKVGLKRGLMASELYEKHGVSMSTLGAYCYHRQRGSSPAGAAGEVHISPRKARAVELAFESAGIPLPRHRALGPSQAEAKRTLTSVLAADQGEVSNG
ncbi:MAG: ORF6N domain-containing protein [Anaerolineae bacterium]|jgi:hypothetical protein|nr:ORF6N domain-containing protein [Anaerolineae bacterium]